MLRPTKGNMYDWVTHTWNPIKGKCSHDCSYCYMKRFPQKAIRLDKKELEDNLGENNFIFVGSSTDMFAKDVPYDWIDKVLKNCKRYPKNKYLFQSKNPMRFFEFLILKEKKHNFFPSNTTLGTTIESNRDYSGAFVPLVAERVQAMEELAGWGFECMVTIEPIMDFDLDMFVDKIRRIRPKWVNIGADSRNHNLPEPSREKVERLIEELKKFTEFKKKHNLDRLVPLDINKKEVTGNEKIS